MNRQFAHGLLASAVLTAAVSCGGGGTGTPTPPASADLVRVSKLSTFAPNCDGVASSDTLYVGAAVEPYLAANPTSPENLIGAWQQNRWSDGGSQGLQLAASFDGGATWKLSGVATSRCTGGNASNDGDYARASDPWVTFSPDGTSYALSLSFTGATFAAGSTSAMLVARSTDGGISWSPPIALIRDGADFFDDKGTITADSVDAAFVYAVWDRVDPTQRGPATLAMTTDRGATWQAARVIYDPGAGNQTLGNQILALPGGTLLDVFTEIDVSSTGALSSSIGVIHSDDHGSTWTARVKVADLLAVGAYDPQTNAAIRDGADLPAATVDANGIIYIVWQDARFSSGQRDGIALSHSTDGGATWSIPVQVNTVPTTQAFTPAVRVAANGVIAVTYYDFRHDTPDPNTLWTDYWLVTSTDAQRWSETHLSGPFNLDLAANSGGLFLGDYQGLASAGAQLLPFFVQPNSSGQPNQTDVFLAAPTNAGVTASQAAQLRGGEGEFVAGSAGSLVVTPEWDQRVQQRIVRTLAQRRRPIL